MDLWKAAPVFFPVYASCMPSIIVLIIGSIIWYFGKESKSLMLIRMKNIIIVIIEYWQETDLPRLQLSGRRKHFMLTSLVIVSMCMWPGILTRLITVSIHSPDVDCFKKKNELKFLDTFAYDETPVNCPFIQSDVFVKSYPINFFLLRKSLFLLHWLHAS